MSDLLTMARNLRPYIELAAQSLPDTDGRRRCEPMTLRAMRTLRSACTK